MARESTFTPKLRRKHYDVVVVGSGGAGSATAETAASEGARVLLVSKDPLVCSDSKISEGIISVRGSGSEGDSVTGYASNVRVQGGDLNDPGITERFAKDSQTAYQWLQRFGINANIDASTQKPIPLSIPMGGHTQARSIDHPNGGVEYGHACWNALQQTKIDIIEDAWFLDLYAACQKDIRSVHGGLIYLASEGEFLSVSASSIILACGGLSTLYFPNTDTMKGNTGDAYAIAARAGAKLVDMEQVQFIPFAAVRPSAYQGLVIGEPISAGVLGTLRDKDGKLLLSEIMGRTRAECSAVIARAVAEGRGTELGACYLDLTENAQGKAGDAYVALMQEKIPSLLKIVRGAMGTKAAKFQEPWEVRPSAHYLMGGIKANAQAEVLDQNDRVIQGLYVAGQALGGLHGSNRLGSTSLSEGIVFGRVAGRSASLFARRQEAVDSTMLETKFLDQYLAHIGDPTEPNGDPEKYQSPLTLLRKLQSSAWRGIGPARTAESIQSHIHVCRQIKEDLSEVQVGSELIWNQAFIDLIETQNLLLCAELIAGSAAERERSLGAHVRLDEPDLSLKQKLTCAPVYSVEVSLQQGKVHLDRVAREASPIADVIKVRGKEKAKILVFKAIRRLPQKAKDRLLSKIYTKAMSQKGMNRDTSSIDNAAMAQAKQEGLL